MSLPTPLITVSADMMGGTPVFTGTRVPVYILFDYLGEGETIDAFLAQYPTISREHVRAVLGRASNAIAPLSLERDDAA
ncbi:MAG: DUF433 domain-containing protein [Pseudomonadota bacterium]